MKCGGDGGGVCECLEMNSELLGREEEGEDGGGATCKKSSWANHGQTRFVSESVGKLAKLRSLLQSMMTRRKDRRRYSLEVSGESDFRCPEIPGDGIKRDSDMD